MLVSAPVATVLGKASHFGQGVCASHHGHRHLGSTVADVHGTNPLGQCSSNRCPYVRLGQATLMHLLHSLHFYLAHFDIHLVARQVAGWDNIAADALSRDNLLMFFHRPTYHHHQFLKPSGSFCCSSPDLERILSGYIAQALAPSTRQTYQSGQRRFLRFCTEAGLQPLPLSEHPRLFVAHLAFS